MFKKWEAIVKSTLSYTNWTYEKTNRVRAASPRVGRKVHIDAAAASRRVGIRVLESYYVSLNENYLKLRAIKLLISDKYHKY